VRYAISAVSLVIGLLLLVPPVVSHFGFTWGCEEYLKRAADCSTPEQCGKELDRALQYMRDHGLTSGNSGIIFKTPASDVAFWYNNIGGAREAVRALEGSEKTSALERSNVLIRVRETLLDEGKAVTLPPHISWYPDVMLMVTLSILGGVSVAASVIAFFVFWSDR